MAKPTRTIKIKRLHERGKETDLESRRHVAGRRRMTKLSKRLKRILRDQAMQAHEEELRRSLLPLSAAFDAWKEDKLSSGELSERVHEFHQGPARELFKKYNGGMLEAVVAHAIVNGVLDRTRVPTELLEALGAWIEFYEPEKPRS